MWQVSIREGGCVHCLVAPPFPYAMECGPWDMVAVTATVHLYTHLERALDWFAPHSDHGVHGRVPGDLQAQRHHASGAGDEPGLALTVT